MELSTSAALEHIQDAVEAVSGRSGVQPRVGVMLGTGLGGLTSEIEVETEISYEDIAHFPVSTVESHTGKLILGTLEGVPVVAMQGRFHRYEGYSLAEVTFPVRVMGSLGIESLIVCASVGGMNPLWELGDLVLVEDHINLLGENPLTGPNIDDLGPRFPDMSEPYDAGLRELALSTAEALQIPLRQGVYVAVTGPNLETRAEYRMLRQIGADVVGMSTVPEVIVARHMGLRVMGVAIITDMCLPDALEVADVQKIIATAMAAEPKLTGLIRGIVGRL